MPHFVVMTESAYPSSTLYAYATNLAAHYPAQLSVLPPESDVVAIRAAVQALRADLLLVGFAAAPDMADKLRGVILRSLLWDCPCPLLLVPDTPDSSLLAPPSAALLLSDGRAVTPTRNVALAGQLLQRWQPALTVLHCQWRIKRAWTMLPVLENLRAPNGLLHAVTTVESSPLDTATLLPDLAAWQQRGNLLVLLPRQPDAQSPLTRQQRLGIVRHSTVPLLIISKS